MQPSWLGQTTTTGKRLVTVQVRAETKSALNLSLRSVLFYPRHSPHVVRSLSSTSPQGGVPVTRVRLPDTRPWSGHRTRSHGRDWSVSPADWIHLPSGQCLPCHPTRPGHSRDEEIGRCPRRIGFTCYQASVFHVTPPGQATVAMRRLVGVPGGSDSPAIRPVSSTSRGCFSHEGQVTGHAQD